MRDARHILLAAQQLQLMERRPGQAGVERTLRGNEKIDPQMAKARLVVFGVDKGARALPGIPLSCMPTGSDPRSEGATVLTGNVAKGRSAGSLLTMQIEEAARANRYFFVVGGRAAGRRSDAEGASPNSERYVTEKQPSSQKP